jgi:diadenylate cyclase
LMRTTCGAPGGAGDLCRIRRALERLGRAGSILDGSRANSSTPQDIQNMIDSVVSGAARLSERRHGALIVLQRLDGLQEYVQTGVRLESRLTPELLLQIFYPNTPLHDGAVILAGSRVIAASCVLPLSSSGVLSRSPERQMGLRHRAALGISESVTRWRWLYRRRPVLSRSCMPAG